MSTDGADYIGVSETLTFHRGHTSLTITIPLIDDVITEDTEHFTASLLPTEPGIRTSSPWEAVISIIDNDGMVYDRALSRNYV